MKNIRNWRIFEFVKDQNGQFSSTRIFAFSIIGTALYEWYSAIWQAGIWHPNATTVGLVMGVLGMKVMKKDQESKIGDNKNNKS
jgi:hypothetical protein